MCYKSFISEVEAKMLRLTDLRTIIEQLRCKTKGEPLPFSLIFLPRTFLLVFKSFDKLV